MKEKLNSIKTRISKTHLDIKMYLKGNKNKYPILFSLFGVLFSMLSVIGVTYALWTDSAETGNNSISTGTITMKYVEDMSFATINNATPTSAVNAYQSNNYFPFQVIMNASGSTELDYEVTITTQNTTTYTYDTDRKIRLGLKKENNIVTDGGFTLEGEVNDVDYTDGVIVADLPTSGSGVTGNPQTIYKGKISSSGGETIHNFKLYLWLDEDAPANTVVETYAIKINVNTGDNNPSYGKYTLTYNNQGGSGCSTKQVRPNNPWGELCTPTKKYYTFEGWYTGQNGTGTEVTASTTASSNQTVYAYFTSRTLYAVLEKASEEGTYAKAYTGSHQDSMNASLSTETIYHWYGSNATNGTAIQDKNNVIFGNHCWQMIRTTDTGGVRLIYNGEAVDGKCLNTRGTHVGYGGDRSSQSLNGTYWYGTDYIYDSTNNVFSVGGTKTSTQVTSSNGSTVIPMLVGKYTCKSTTESGTCSTLYLIESYKSSYNAYAIPINSSSNYSQFGTIQFNAASNSPAYVGYMYNTVYPVTGKSQSYSIATVSVNLSNYYYSDTISYDNVANKYTLTNPIAVSTLADYSVLVGKYLGSNNLSQASVYYVSGMSGTSAKCRALENGDLATSLMVGDSYTDNGNNTYTLNNTTLVTYIDWYNSSDFSQYKGKYVCDGTSATCSNLKHIATSQNPTKEYYYYFGTGHSYKYSEGVSYNNGTYTLTGDIKTIWDIYDSTELAKINTHHYTCLSTSTSCTTVSYANIQNGVSMYYMSLTGVNDIETALTNMLTASDVNTKNSTMKFGIDAWYKKYLLPYDSYIDDTIYCNDRSIRSLGTFNSDGGGVTNYNSNYLQFKENNVGTDLSCTNITDRFSVSNSSAQLTYKVGLMSSPEMNLLNQSNARKTGQYYWLVSPYHFGNDGAIERVVYPSGSLGGSALNNSFAARPAVSLIPGIEYTSGDGSMANPYVVDTN